MNEEKITRVEYEDWHKCPKCGHDGGRNIYLGVTGKNDEIVPRYTILCTDCNSEWKVVGEYGLKCMGVNVIIDRTFFQKLKLSGQKKSSFIED